MDPSRILGRANYLLRGGFLIRPLAISLVLGAAGGLLPILEATSDQTRFLQLFSRIQPQLAQTIFATIAGGVMTVVSIVFAILLMSLTLASMQFSPRILVGFTRDRVTQWTLGVFLGTFSYCVFALPWVRVTRPERSPIVTVQGAMLLALISVVLLIYFIHHIAHSISVNYIVDRLASETETTIDDLRIAIARVTHPAAPLNTTPVGMTTPIPSLVSGYIRTINLEKVLETAEHHACVVTIVRRVGHFVPKDVPLCQVTAAARVSNEALEKILRAFEIGPTRSLEQDVEFGILQIVDIALRAISPAVNDPSTAISCVDQLGRILIYYAKSPPEANHIYDSSGKTRIMLPVLGLERMVHAAVDQIRSYSKGDVAVSLRMLRALGDLSGTLRDPETRSMLAIMGRRILIGSEALLEEDELSELRRRQSELEALAGA